jgi:NAD(P)-dependent dehydrogenase (short-subunit alcohol dehydrogenase family)
MIRFDSQVAIVTGSGRGLGEAYVSLLAARGARVVVHDAGVTLDGQGFDPTVVDNAVQRITAAGGIAVPCYENIETREGCQRVVETALEHFGRLDILVSNAGWIMYTPLEEVTPELFARVMNIQIAAPFWLSQAAFRVMKQQHYGRVVLTSSGRALFAEYALPDLSGYAIGKISQIGLMHALNAAGADAGILVNTIVPVAATRMLRRPVAPQEMRPEQVAPGVVFLASQECKDAGIILLANNGLFSTIRWQETPDINFGTQPTTPEEIAEKWQQISAGF